MKVAEIAVGAVFAPTRFSVVRISIHDLVAEIPYRNGETTIKIKFSLWRGAGHGGGEENRPKTLFFFFFVGSARTINFESANFIVEKFCCHCAGSYP